MKSRKVIENHEPADISEYTHEMCVCDSYPAWRALALLLGYSLHVHAECSDDKCVYRDAKDPFGRITGTFVMFADPQMQNAGHILIPARFTSALSHGGKAVSLPNDMQRYNEALGHDNTPDPERVDSATGLKVARPSNQANIKHMLAKALQLIYDAQEAHDADRQDDHDDFLSLAADRVAQALATIRFSKRHDTLANS